MVKVSLCSMRELVNNTSHTSFIQLVQLTEITALYFAVRLRIPLFVSMLRLSTMYEESRKKY